MLSFFIEQLLMSGPNEEKEDEKRRENVGLAPMTAAHLTPVVAVTGNH